MCMCMCKQVHTHIRMCIYVCVLHFFNLYVSSTKIYNFVIYLNYKYFNFKFAYGQTLFHTLLMYKLIIEFLHSHVSPTHVLEHVVLTYALILS